MNKNTEQADDELLLIESWLTFLSVNRGHAVSTINKYRGYLKQLQRYLVEKHDNTRLLQARQSMLEDFTGLFLHKKGVAPKSRHVVVAACKGFFQWLVDQELAVSNPSHSLQYPNVGRKLPKQLGLSNAERLLMQPDIDTFKGVRDAAMLSLLIGCGMRVSGLVNLNQEDLFWFDYKGQQRLAVLVTEKGGHERELTIPHEAMLLLQAYLGHEELKDIDRTLPDGSQVLFVSTRNRRVPLHEYRGEYRRLTTKSVWSMMQGYGIAAGLPEELCHPHAIRHMLGAEMMEEDASTLQVQAVFGHADPKTSEIYARIARGKLTEVIDKANPLRKINTPVSPLVKEMKKRGAL
ncbi:tyrosine-type recombinase/integrase [Endozoicomonas gorgoniicola]|uniref:Tyrosine-type recombinase/integrase n=1 Tax=Endozoicomonas gorgoniicola TaxID=1234144 RepID=A0ABT3MWB9_9GAMM|nr:tyrosine-type recombinase/integrase [Endozoicomonas gorgoniicola]MCW7553668.1 tyrosine-type recombinase/integrase [Endozoicomonas gorgoniicola]